ncbi:MAG: Flagellar hook-associated protein 1 [Pelotomaculum sp. PtaB.Bin104]|nr:MAG: Flagellar hook-associated protein 1 [Pelotomaculum sp. PtaB.Bin104]
MSGPGTFFGLEITRRGLQTSRAGMDVTGHNLANLNTEGYTRQESVQTASDPYCNPVFNQIVVPGLIGTGVEVSQIRRIRDEFLDANLRNIISTTNKWDELDSVNTRVESLFPEPDSGMSKQISTFFDYWSDLNSSPQSIGVRSAVREAADSLAYTIRQTYRQVTDEKTSTTNTIADKIDRINGIASEIVNLNKGIANSVYLGKQPNDLMDKRDLLLDELAGIIDVSTVQDTNGMVYVQISGKDLVKNDNTTVTAGASLEVDFDAGIAHKYTVNGVEINLDYNAANTVTDAVNAINLQTATTGVEAEEVGGKIRFYSTTSANRELDFSLAVQNGGNWQGAVFDDNSPVTLTNGSTFTVQGFLEGGSLGTAKTYTIDATNNTLATLAAAINADSATTGVSAIVSGAGTANASLRLVSVGVGPLKVNDGVNAPLAQLMGEEAAVPYRVDELEGTYFDDNPPVNLTIGSTFAVQGIKSDGSLGTAKTYNIDATNNTLTTLADAINADSATTGVKAVVTNAGTDLASISLVSAGGGQLRVTDGVNSPLSTLMIKEPPAASYDVSTESGALVLDFIDTTGSVTDSVSPNDGALAGLETARQNIDKYLSGLDTLAMALKDTVNYLHENGGTAFFDETSVGAADFDLASEIKDDLNNINSNQALNIAAMRTELTMSNRTATFENYYAGVVSGMGADVKTARETMEAQDIICEQNKKIRDSVTGVSSDEELTKLIQYQYAFQASSKVVTTIDEMLDTLINRML